MTFNPINFERNVRTNGRIIDGERIINNWNKGSNHSPAQPSNTRSYHSSGDRIMARDHDACYGKRLITFYASANDSKASVVSAGNS